MTHTCAYACTHTMPACTPTCTNKIRKLNNLRLVSTQDFQIDSDTSEVLVFLTSNIFSMFLFLQTHVQVTQFTILIPLHICTINQNAHYTVMLTKKHKIVL